MSIGIPSTDPIFVAGYGRSGTNWLLNLLDLHPATHCRNEPDALATSQFKWLPSPERPVAASADFAPLWDAAVQWACLRYGERDRMPRHRKDYLRGQSTKLKLWRMLEKRRVRTALGVTSPTLRTAEWTIPWWLDAPDALLSARHVLKLNDRHAWFAWVMAHRPAARVVHLVRHPGGVLQSWRNRWLGSNDPEFVRRQCVARLARIAELNPAWAQRFGDPEQLPASEAELWYWRYSTEQMSRHGERSPGYKRVLYEQLASDPVHELRDVYAFCGLSWDAAIEHAIEPADDSRPKRGRYWYERVPVDPQAAAGWRARTSAEDLELIDRILTGSPMQHWWPSRN